MSRINSHIRKLGPHLVAVWVGGGTFGRWSPAGGAPMNITYPRSLNSKTHVFQPLYKVIVALAST